MCISMAMMSAISLATTAASTMMQMSQANKSAQAMYDMEAMNLRNIYSENQRQQHEANRVAQEEMSDRMRKASMELSTVNAMAAELGAAGSSLAALASEVGTTEGMDLSRIEGNRERQNDAIQSRSKAGMVGYINNTTLAHNQTSAAKTNALMSGIGSGLQIGADYAYKQKQLEIAKHKVT